MANITSVAFDQNKSDKCRVKSIKGFFRYNDNRENPEGTVKSLVKEIADGVYLNFIVRYFWCGENGNDCYLEIGWEPAYLNNGVRERYSKGLSEYFGADNACEVVINGESITLLAGSDNKQTLDSYSMKIFDDTLEPAWIGMVNSLDPSIKNIEITFNYENSQNDGIDTYINIDKLNKVKILRPSRYENNVVFNRDGLNEMIDYFKKYPVVDLTTSEKYGHIRISYGDSEKDIDIAPYGFEEGTSGELFCSTSFLPSANNTFTLGQGYDNITGYYHYKDQKYHRLMYDENEGFTDTGGKVDIIMFPNINTQFHNTYIIFISTDNLGTLNPFSIQRPTDASLTIDETTLQTLQNDGVEISLSDIAPALTRVELQNIKLNHIYPINILSNKVEGTFFRSFTVQFLSDEILLNAQKPAKKWRDLYLSNILSANTGLFNTSLTASKIYGAFHGTEDGQSININDNFIVDASGDVQLKGNITWGENQFMYVYHKGADGDASQQPITPTNDIIYEEDVAVSNISKRWHKNYNSNVRTNENDHWISMTFDGGLNWSTPTYINAKDGEKGDDGYWTNENILEALNDEGVAKGLFWFPGQTNEDTGQVMNKLGFKADVITAALACFNKINMNPGKYYEATTDTSFNGGYISFAIPTPFTKDENTNQYPCLSNQKPGWRARLGYLRGNGDMQTSTAGLGLAIYTDATWDDKYSHLTCHDNTGSETKHLVLSILMLTQSGLGLLTVQNTNYNGTNPQLWINNDDLRNRHNTQVPHYGYTWWGATKTYNILKRLWLDENNGCLYESTGASSLQRKYNLAQS